MTEKSPEDAAREAFERMTAVTIAALAGVLAIVSMFSSNATSDSLLSATRAANSWAYYQSKSIKEHTFEIQREALETLAPSATDPAKRDAFLAKCASEAARYGADKEKVKLEAEGFEKAIVDATRVSDRCGTAIPLLQIAIVIASTSLLVRKKALLVAASVLGFAGIVVAATAALPPPPAPTAATARR